MQALTRTVFPCYSAADRESAEILALFLERCGDICVFLEDGEMRPGQNLAEKAREARTADVVLVLFSRNSLPSRWPRAEWEDALINEPAADDVRIAFIRLDDCIPPRILVPQFDWNGRPLKVMRALKRWVRHRQATFLPPENPRAPGQEGDLEVLSIAIGDRPGCETVVSRALAFEFVRACREDFDEIFCLECGGRSLPALAGDWASQLGLRLEGSIEENVERLRDFCSARRFLLLFDGMPSPAAHQLIFRGGCSTIIAENGPVDAVSDDPLRTAQRLLRDANASADWVELSAQARLGRRLCTEQGRIAECFELMEQWHAVAQVHNDRVALEESAREMVWILETWGRDEEALRLEQQRVKEYAEQMTLLLFD